MNLGMRDMLSCLFFIPCPGPYGYSFQEAHWANCHLNNTSVRVIYMLFAGTRTRYFQTGATNCAIPLPFALFKVLLTYTLTYIP